MTMYVVQHACIHALHTMQMHEVHQESRDIFAISLATGTEPQIPELSRGNRDGWHVCHM